MIRNLIPWSRLTREGIPPMKVCRREMQLGEVIIPVGETLDVELLPMDIRRTRLRQFYEMRLLEPVVAPPDTRQLYIEKLQRALEEEKLQAEVPVVPVSPVASRIVADLPAIDVPDLDRRRRGAR